MKSLESAPSSTLRYWGMQSIEAFDFVARYFGTVGCSAPRWGYGGGMVLFTLKPSAGVKVAIGLSQISADNGYATFDCSAVILSKTLFELEPDSGRENLKGFRPCLTIQLSHLKWCEGPSDKCPLWAMSLQRDVRVNAHDFIDDFSKLLLPVLSSVDSDESLEALLVSSISYRKPEWVKSDGPGFVRLPMLLELLQKGIRSAKAK